MDTNNTETKKSNVVGTLVLIIILLLAAGFAYYKLIFEPSKYVIDDAQNVETKLITKTSGGEFDIIDILININNADESDAVYYYVDVHDDEGYMEETYDIYQTDYEAFSNMHDKNTGAAVKKLSKWSEALFSISYDNNSIKKIAVPNITLEESIERIFGTDLLSYAKDNEIKLQCDGIDIKKVVWLPESDISNAMMLASGTAKVTTLSGKSDLFPPTGETKYIQFYISGFYSGDSTFNVNYFYFQ